MSAIRNGHWVADGGIAWPKSILWLDCWARTGQNSEKAKIAAKAAFEEIFKIDHLDFSKKVPHHYSRENQSSFDHDRILKDLENC